MCKGIEYIFVCIVAERPGGRVVQRHAIGGACHVTLRVGSAAHFVYFRFRSVSSLSLQFLYLSLHVSRSLFLFVYSYRSLSFSLFYRSTYRSIALATTDPFIAQTMTHDTD